MNKKLLAIAVAAFVAAPAIATADTTLYGQLNFELQSAYDAVNDKNAVNTDSYGSRIGVKGSEDLGGGLKGIFQLEGSVNPTTGSNTANWNRNTFIGLSGGFGTVLTGRHDHPYKLATLPFRNFGDTGVDNRGGFVAQSFLRSGGVVAYISPNISGFQVSGAVVPLNDGTGSSKAPYSLAATYRQGPLYATLAYEDMEDAGLDYDALMAGATYAIAGATVGLMYEQLESQSSSDKSKRWLLPITYDVNNNVTLRAAVKYDDNGDDATDFALGAIYNFSKRTEAYANVWTILDNDETEFALGMRHKF